MRGDFSEILLKYLKKFQELHIEKRRFACVVVVLALMVAGGVTWRMKYTGIAMTNETVCGLEEHVHTEECYEYVLVCGMEETEGHVHTEDCYEDEEVLICGEEESEGHIHTDDCYEEIEVLVCDDEDEDHVHDDSCFEIERELVCGEDEYEGHTHTADCYETERVLICEEEEEEEGHVHTDECYEKVLICEKEEHTHTVECLGAGTVSGSGNTESRSDWKATLPNLTGIERVDLVAVAESQIGYTESETNFEIDDDGEVRGYTRYGAWYGSKYGKWDSMFVSFCLYYAKIPESDFPQEAGAYAWRAELDKLGLYEEAGDYTPIAGDVAFFDTDGDGRADSTGIVSYVDGDTIYIIEGDYYDEVCENAYDLFDDLIIGYGVLPYEEYIEEPTEEPIEEATEEPSEFIIELPTRIPIEEPTEAPHEETQPAPTEKPPDKPPEKPSEEPTAEPTEEPTAEPTDEATAAPTEEATAAPSELPTAAPTEEPTAGPSETPTAAPTEEPTAAPTTVPAEEMFELTYEGEDYTVTVAYGAEAEIPEGAELAVSEYDKDSERYAERYEEAAEIYGWAETDDGGLAIMSLDESAKIADVEFRLFNIEFIAEGEVIEPAAEVTVTITLNNVESDPADYSVTHFREDADTEVLDVQTTFEDDAHKIEFVTESFSDYGLTITSADDLDGETFAILSYTQNYAMLAEANTSNNGLKKTDTSSTSISELQLWTFEKNGNGYRIYYTDDSGTKYYLRMTYDSTSAGSLSLTTGTNNATTFTVTVNSDGTIYLSASVKQGPNNYTYYINQYGGDSGDADSVGFRGYTGNDNGSKLYLAQQASSVDSFLLWMWNEDGTQAANYGSGISDTIRYVDDDNTVWYLIPVSYFEDAYASSGYTFDSSSTDDCPFEYAPNAYYSTSDLTTAKYIEYNGSWYVAVQDTTGLTVPRSNVYYTGTVADGAYVSDNIINDGTFVATVYVNGVEMTDYANYTYTWYKSEDGVTYEIVTDTSVLSDNTINIAEDNGGLCYYYFVAEIDGLEYQSEPLQVPYATELLNGSFEEVDTSNKGTGSSVQYDEEDVYYWSTTSSGSEIEIGKYTADPLVYGATDTEFDSSVGYNFAELNAASSGALYQDVLTADGETLYWSLLHRARNAIGAMQFVNQTVTDNGDGTYTIETTATDTMYVVIMSASDAEKVLDGVSDSDQQSVLTAMIESVLNGSDYASGEYKLVSGDSAGETVTVTVWEITTTSTGTITAEVNGYGQVTSIIDYDFSSWVSYSGEYEVPDGQYLTRFFFVAGETATGNTSVGNLLDQVAFSQDMTYTIEYWVWNSTTQQYDLVTSDTETGEVGPYTYVYASYMDRYSANYALVDSITGTASGGSNPDSSAFDDPTTTGMKVKTGTNYLSLYFSNEGISIIKVLDGLSEAALEEIAAAGGAEFTFHVVGGNIDTYVTVTVDESGIGSTYIYTPDLGTYTVTETAWATTLLDGTYTWQSVSPAQTQTVTLTTTESAATLTFTNSYDREITLKKVSSTSSSATLEGAEFIVYMVDDSTGDTYYYTGSDWSDDEADAYVYTTGTDGTVAVKGLDDGTYYLREITAPAGYYALTSDIEFTISGSSLTIDDPNSMSSVSGMEITVANKSGSAMPSTGGAGTETPYTPIVAGVLLLTAALAILFKKPRRKGECET